MAKFNLVSEWQACGEQPKAIESLVRGFSDQRRQTLLGVTGSGKTFVMANLIAELGLPTLVLSPNKTLAAQLYSEFKQFFPGNAVEYFVSYYDFYQPEAYIPQRDIYIEKDASINDQIDRLRMAATSALLSREDVVIIASISCIYSLGDPADYKKMVLVLNQGQSYSRHDILLTLVEMQYQRNDYDLARSNFRVRGDVIDIWPSYLEITLRLEFFGDLLERVSYCDSVSGKVLESIPSIVLYAAKHYVIPQEKLERAISAIQEELNDRLATLKRADQLLEASRLEMRTRYDIEMLQEVGYCSGIENYSRHFSDRRPGDRPHCLFDYFPRPFLTIVDESHVTMPQLRGMYIGDRSRKRTLIEHGFRLPSALDNRPNTLEEWENFGDRVLFVSATPSSYEIEKSGDKVVELLVRPTGLVDPILEVRPATDQIQDLLTLIQQRAAVNERVLVTTLTKRLAEDLTEFLQGHQIQVAYLHHEIDSFERVEILQDLRRGKYQAVVGINLLREGLDLPEVSLVAILDADREGFLRSETSLIQTIGRAARHVNAMVVLYADNITASMQRAIAETDRRRNIQLAYNEMHGITPQSIHKEILAGIEQIAQNERKIRELVRESPEQYNTREQIAIWEEQMMAAAANLDFETAAVLRDRILEMQGLKKSKKGGKKKKSRPR